MIKKKRHPVMALLIAEGIIVLKMAYLGLKKSMLLNFKELSVDHYTLATRDIGLMAVLVDVKTPSFEEIVKQLLFSDKAEDEMTEE